MGENPCSPRAGLPESEDKSTPSVTKCGQALSSSCSLRPQQPHMKVPVSPDLCQHLSPSYFFSSFCHSDGYNVTSNCFCFISVTTRRWSKCFLAICNPPSVSCLLVSLIQLSVDFPFFFLLICHEFLT